MEEVQIGPQVTADRNRKRTRKPKKKSKSTGKPKKVAQEKKLAPTKLDPTKVRFLSAEQVRSLIDPHDLDRDITDEFVTTLQANINQALKWLKPSNDRSPTTNLTDIRELLKKLGRKLTAVNIEIVSGVSAASKREFHPYHGMTTDVAAIEILKRFADTSAEVLHWLEDRKACEIVLSSLRPDVGMVTVAGHLLPNVFELSFFKKFGSGSTGPGLRFVVAVMREAGLLHHDDDTTAVYVREARRRMLKPPR